MEYLVPLFIHWVVQIFTFLCVLVILMVQAVKADDLRLGDGGCVVVKDMRFVRGSGQHPAHMTGTIQNSCSGQVTVLGTILFINRRPDGNDEQVDDSPLAQDVGQGLTVRFDVEATKPESVSANTAKLSNPQAVQAPQP